MPDPTARTLSLLSLLQTHRVWRGADLAAELGVSERTVRRDIDRLRGLGYPVDAGPGVDGGYRLAVGAHLPPLLLTDEEAVALTIGLRATALSAIEGIEDSSVGLMAKLDQVLPDRLRRRIDALQQSVQIMSFPRAAATVRATDLTVLSQACRDREEVRFTYRRRDGEVSSRLVQPHQLVSAGRRWYLVAWDVRRDDWRTFRVDRMGEPTLAGVRFERRQLPAEDAATFVRDGMRVTATQHSAVVIVVAPPGDLAALGHWFGSTPEPVDADRSRMTIADERADGVAAMIATIATRFDVEIETASREIDAAIDAALERMMRVRRVPGPPGRHTPY
jgi:predicted DNA-binding transcriptional regulator YafY